MAFVGISNYSLDASKMNRILHLSRSEPTKKDLLETATSIRDEMKNKHPRMDQYIEIIVEIYMKYKEMLSKKY